MKILIAHNYYQHRGGEDSVFESEADLLTARGHDVRKYVEDNDSEKVMGRTLFALKALGNATTRSNLKKVLKTFYPDVVHCHNPYYLFSPTFYDFFKERNIPVVQSLHNSRMFCPAARLFRDGRYCEECLGKFFPVPGIRHRCFRNSWVKTAWIGLVEWVYRTRHVWQDKVSAFIVFSRFYKEVFTRAGIPAEKIFVKPHFLAEDPGARKNEPENFALFVGRLSADKGIMTLLDVWQEIDHLRLVVIGSGEQESLAREFVQKKGIHNIEFLGAQENSQVISYIKRSRFVIIPSEVAETFGLVALEAMACGVPILASRIGGLSELIRDGENGFLFLAGNKDDLLRCVKKASSDYEQLNRMGKASREIFEKEYGKEQNYQTLMKIYNSFVKVL